MPIEKLRPKAVFDEQRIEGLKQIAPEAFADGKINWEVLKEALGDYTENEGPGEEHFGLFWPGKREARRLAGLPSKGTLVPMPGEGMDEDTTRNIFIEGENLEVLKLLQKSYAGRIKMIYIDPPYNTGNDFVYDDNFTETIEDYLMRTGQIDEEGRKLTTNSKADGRFHSKWLSMMYPRLRLAKNLLKDDGLIFVSIDDNEIHNLRPLMNEVFGEENYQQQITWKNKYGPGALTKGFGRVHEYVLCYSKGRIESINAHLTEEEIQKYKTKDEKYHIRGGYITQPLATKSKDDRPNLVYPIKYKGKEIWPDKQWIWQKDRLEKAIANDEVIIKETDGKFSVRFKQYLKDENENMRYGKPLSLLVGPFNQEGTEEISRLFDKPVFDFPKPVDLIKYFFSMVINENTETDGIFLDFFAGSGTSMQAILELNAADKGRRSFIGIQLPEQIDKNEVAYREGYEKISSISIDRVKRFAKKLDKKTKMEIDTGVKALRLVASNFKIWENVSDANPQKLELQFETFESPLIDNWKPEDLLIEILLIEGFPLDSKIEVDAYHKKNKVQSVSSDFCEHRLVVCLDKKVAADTIKSLQLSNDDVFICLDSAITDEQKVTLSDKGLIKTI